MCCYLHNCNAVLKIRMQRKYMKRFLCVHFNHYLDSWLVYSQFRSNLDLNRKNDQNGFKDILDIEILSTIIFPILDGTSPASPVNSLKVEVYKLNQNLS